MNFKHVIFISFFLIFFLWWYKNIHIPEVKDSFYLQKIQVSTGKSIFGHPAKSGVVEIEYIGFISGFDTLKKNPLWVSYNLKSSWLKAAKNLDERDFKPDPNLPSHWMSDLKDFKKSGYDRGHIARQADMHGRNLKCEQESCYLTNISPQVSEFNQKTWLNLENAVQKWAVRYDSLWIIAGPWFDKKQELLNHNTEIPDGFYKIIVMVNNSQYKILSFIFKQSDRNLDLNSYIVSVDSIEKVTGIDFFPELPDSIENLVEKGKYKIWAGWR